MNKKGFTLIEALAVIVLVGLLVALISSKVLSSINESKEKTKEANANSLVNVIEKYFMEKKMSDGFIGCFIDFDNKVSGCSDLAFSGTSPDSGFISVNSEGVDCDFTYGNTRFYCENGNVIKTVPYAEYVFSTVGQHSIIVPYDAEYTLEVWGAQGGSSGSYNGGYGGYSYEKAFLKKGDVLYINVGGQGETYSSSKSRYSGGYNGGGYGYKKHPDVYPAGGGGATHISFRSGELSTLEQYKGNLDTVNNVYRSDDILIVAGGGAGAYRYSSSSGAGKSGGGYSGGYGSVSSTPGTQTTGAYFGNASDTETVFSNGTNHSGGGGGFYGGHFYWNGNAGGGSGYIGYSGMKDGVMYCYDCSESNDVSTKTISTTGSNKDSVNCPDGYSGDAVSNCAKAGNGYARIVTGNIPKKNLVLYSGYKFKYDFINSERVLNIPQDGFYRLEVWGASGGNTKLPANSPFQGGKGGYSRGTVYLHKDAKIYINVGQKGYDCVSSSDTVAYNGGSGGILCTLPKDGTGRIHAGAGGGGATHIALSSGLLSSFDSDEDGYGNAEEISDILIVAGAGGGAYYHDSGSYKGHGGNGGGAAGTSGTSYNNITPPTGGTQSSGGAGAANGSFGLGGNLGNPVAGGGSGFYGGGAPNTGTGQYGISGAGGGSGYIGYSAMIDKVMYCYNCAEDLNSSSLTYSTTGSNGDYDRCPDGYSSDAISDCAKVGDGAAIITYMGN